MTRLVVFLAASCAPRPAPPPPVERLAESVAEFEAVADEMRRAYLARDTVPAPTLASEAPQTVELDGVRVTVSPVSAERQAWNAWPDGTARLFNDGLGYLWRVHLETERDVRWDPAATALAVNDSDQVFTPAVGPDELLQPVLQGAMLESALGARGDLALRARAADDFRRAYLSTRASPGPRDGVVVFPAPTRQIHTVAMELRLALVVEGVGDREFRFLFE
ncbi:MAG: hypothetical protein ACOZNI_03490 [Myxococcota bacterium]